MENKDFIRALDSALDAHGVCIGNDPPEELAHVIGVALLGTRREAHQAERLLESKKAKRLLYHNQEARQILETAKSPEAVVGLNFLMGSGATLEESRDFLRRVWTDFLQEEWESRVDPNEPISIDDLDEILLEHAPLRWDFARRLAEDIEHFTEKFTAKKWW